MNASTRTPSPVLVALLFVGATFALLSGLFWLWPDSHPATPADIAADADRAPPQAVLRYRCDTCGVISAIHHTAAAGGQPESYEFAVSLRDGSTRRTRDPLPGRWAVGDHIQLIRGAAAAHGR